jgi:hypothetical protein
VFLEYSVGRAAQSRARVAVADPAWRLGVDLVSAGHARHVIAGEQDEVEDGRGEADQGFDPPPERELTCGAMRHGGRL